MYSAYWSGLLFSHVDLGHTTSLQLQIGDPIEARFKEWAERASAVSVLEYCIKSFREAALSSDQKYDHIDIADKQKVGHSIILIIISWSQQH